MSQNPIRRQGLTLVEVVIVLLIVQVALLVSVQTFVRGLHIHQQTAGRSRAALVAQTVMDALLRDASAQGVSLAATGTFPESPQPVNGAALGLEPSTVEGLKWQVDVAPHGESPVLRELTLRLVWTAAEREKQFELVSLAAVQPRRLRR